MIKSKREKIWISLIFAVSQLAFSQGRSVLERRDMVKPGKCRRLSNEKARLTSECADSCVYDSECPGLTKCCDVGCGLRCVGGSYFLQLPTADEEKSQLCPPEKMFAIRPCETHSVLCRTHSECKLDAVCCNDGCDTKCIPRGSLVGEDGICRSTGWIFHPGEMFQKPGCLLCICFSAKRQKCHHLKNCGAMAENQGTLLVDGLETDVDLDQHKNNSTNSILFGLKDNYVNLNAILQAEKGTFNLTKNSNENSTNNNPLRPRVNTNGSRVSQIP